MSNDPGLIRPTGTASVVATPISQTAALAGYGDVIRVANGGGVPVYVEFGTRAVVASVASSMMILPGCVELFALQDSDVVDSFAAVTESGQARISVTRCAGDR